MPFEKMGFDLFGFGSDLVTRTWQLQRSYQWQLFMPSSIGGVLGYWVSQYCVGARFGDYKFGQLSTVQYGGQQRKYPSLQSIDNVSLVFAPPTDYSVYNYFYNWKNLVVDEDGYYGAKNDYAKNFYLVMHDTAGVETAKFKFCGAFPISIPPFELDYQKEDLTWMRVDLSVDKIETGGLISKLSNTLRTGRQIVKAFE